ncbi:MAG: hypothetical protein V2A79_09890 [Planctomycetota bacterium]
MGGVWYNEIDPFCCDWLKGLMAAGLIPQGVVDDRDIREVKAAELAGYGQVHLFAGIGGWARALQLADWGDRAVWTGSCPCPPFSCAGKKKRCPACASRNLMPHVFRTGVFACCDCGHEWDADGRHLWPEFRRLIEARRPAVVLGEQVAGKDGEIWLAGVQASMEVLSYDFRRADVPAASVAAPHPRQRLWWCAERLADTECKSGNAQHVEETGERSDSPAAHGSITRIGRRAGGLADTGFGSGGLDQSQRGPERRIADRGDCRQAGGLADAAAPGLPLGQVAEDGRGALREERQAVIPAGPWSRYAVAWCDERAAGKGFVPRRVPESVVRLLDDGSSEGVAGLRPEAGWPLAVGVENRAQLLKALGNAIVPQVAAEFVRSIMESAGDS